MRCKYAVFWFFYCVCYVYAVSSNIWYHIKLVFTMTVLFGLHSFWTIKPALVNSVILSKMVRRSSPCCFPSVFSGTVVAHYFYFEYVQVKPSVLPSWHRWVGKSAIQYITFGILEYLIPIFQLFNISILESWNILFLFFSYSISQFWNLGISYSHFSAFQYLNFGLLEYLKFPFPTKIYFFQESEETAKTSLINCLPRRSSFKPFWQGNTIILKKGKKM